MAAARLPIVVGFPSGKRRLRDAGLSRARTRGLLKIFYLRRRDDKVARIPPVKIL